jgi:hypothetical protein
MITPARVDARPQGRNSALSMDNSDIYSPSRQPITPRPPALNALNSQRANIGDHLLFSYAARILLGRAGKRRLFLSLMFTGYQVVFSPWTVPGFRWIWALI